MTTANLSDYLYYAEDSPTKLRWKVDIYSGVNGCALKIAAGEVAGSFQGSYYQVTVQQVNYMAHRVIWEITNGEIPSGYQIDHKNGVRTDNAISNLRAIPRCLNQRNMAISKRNKSGHAGVCYTEVKDRDGVKVYPYWVAGWMGLDGKYKAVSYSVSKLGFDEAKQQAIIRREFEIAKMNDLGAGYTEDHGKRQ